MNEFNNEEYIAIPASLIKLIVLPDNKLCMSIRDYLNKNNTVAIIDMINVIHKLHESALIVDKIDIIIASIYHVAFTDVKYDIVECLENFGYNYFCYTYDMGDGQDHEIPLMLTLDELREKDYRDDDLDRIIENTLNKINKDFKINKHKDENLIYELWRSALLMPVNDISLKILNLFLSYKLPLIRQKYSC